MKPKYIIGFAVVAVFLVLALLSFDSSKIEYANVAQAKESGKTVQIIGKWDKSKEYHYDAQANKFSFVMLDEKNNPTKVVFSGMRPNNFDIAESIVIKGKYANNEFIASEILTKCPSKYEAKSADLKKMQ